MFHNLPAVLMKCALLQRSIDAERQRTVPSALRLLRLTRLKLMLETRLHRLADLGRTPMRSCPVVARVPARAGRS